MVILMHFKLGSELSVCLVRNIFPASCKVESYNWTQTKSKWDSSPAAIFALGTHSMRITCTERVANSSRTVAAAGNSWQSGCQNQRIWNASTPSGWSTPLVLMQMTNTWERLPFNQLFFQSVPTRWIQVLFLHSHPNESKKSDPVTTASKGF